MLTEEAITCLLVKLGLLELSKTLDTMKSLKTDDPDLLNKNGVIDLPLIQKYLNFWYSSSLDLFGLSPHQMLPLVLQMVLKAVQMNILLKTMFVINNIFIRYTRWY